MATDFQLRLAARCLLEGGIIAYPTDTLFGLGCDALNEQAVARLNALKQRPPHKPFILLADRLPTLYECIEPPPPELRRRILDTRTPTSWLCPAAAQAPHWLGARGDIAIRISQDPLTRRLCQLTGRPLTSTSANHSGQPPADDALQCRRRFPDGIDVYLHSSHPRSKKASQLRRLCDNTRLR